MTHVHGSAGVGDESDGYAEAWYLAQAGNIPAEFATNGTWYLAGAGIWAAFGGDRAASPFMDVDMDAIYGDVQVGRRVTVRSMS